MKIRLPVAAAFFAATLIASASASAEDPVPTGRAAPAAVPTLAAPPAAPRVAAAPTVPAAPADPADDAAQPMFGGEHIARIRDEIHLHEQRAHELEPIIARDRQARHDVEVDWVILERHARELHARAGDFRAYASESLSPRAQRDMTLFANELDQFAVHDEENAAGQHDIAGRLDHAIEIGNDTRDWHVKLAQRLRDWLSYNGF